MRIVMPCGGWKFMVVTYTSVKKCQEARTFIQCVVGQNVVASSSPSNRNYNDGVDRSGFRKIKTNF